MWESQCDGLGLLGLDLAIQFFLSGEISASLLIED